MTYAVFIGRKPDYTQPHWEQYLDSILDGERGEFVATDLELIDALIDRAKERGIDVLFFRDHDHKRFTLTQLDELRQMGQEVRG